METITAVGLTDFMPVIEAMQGQISVSTVVGVLAGVVGVCAFNWAFTPLPAREVKFSISVALIFSSFPFSTIAFANGCSLFISSE